MCVYKQCIFDYNAEIKEKKLFMVCLCIYNVPFPPFSVGCTKFNVHNI